MKIDPKKPCNNLPLLPPPEDLMESRTIWQAEAAARQALAELKGYAHVMPNQAILINAAVIQEAKDSSEIENIITTQDALYRALTVDSGIIDAHTKEVVNYREAVFNGAQSIKKKHILSVNDMVEIQTIIVGNDAGIRKLPGTTLANNATGYVIYTPPDNSNTIRQLMANLADFLNDKESSLIRMAVTHYQFEAIHPFYDGNGRTGRIVNVLYLILKEYLDVPMLYLSSYIIRNKADYYQLLRNVTFKNEWQEWILFMLKGIEETSLDTINRIKRIITLLDKTIDTVRTQARAIYTKELVELLFEEPYCKAAFIERKIGVERKAAARYLKTLEDLGILAKKKIGRENIYINIKLMKILKG
jgi:Fic family protein